MLSCCHRNSLGRKGSLIICSLWSYTQKVVSLRGRVCKGWAGLRGGVRLGHGFLIICTQLPRILRKTWWPCVCGGGGGIVLMIPQGAGIGRGRNFTLGTPIFISRRTVSSTDKVTCTPKVLIPSSRSTLARHSCVLSGCPCVCVCVCARVWLCVCPPVNLGADYSWSILYSMPLLSPCLSSPACLPPHHCLYLHRPCPSRTIFLSGLVAISSLSASVPSFLPFIPLSPLFSFLPLFPLLSPSSSLQHLPPPCSSSSFSVSLSPPVSISISHSKTVGCLSCNNPISSQMTSWALKASYHTERPAYPARILTA